MKSTRDDYSRRNLDINIKAPFTALKCHSNIAEAVRTHTKKGLEALVEDTRGRSWTTIDVRVPDTEEQVLDIIAAEPSRGTQSTITDTFPSTNPALLHICESSEFKTVKLRFWFIFIRFYLYLQMPVNLDSMRVKINTVRTSVIHKKTSNCQFSPSEGANS
ncbi:hypothetical protein HUJ04_003171 [Dendroctonus ponderosae]|nr:hypothetical protein HUJ04_003171 [Dendroctonus ponderosae]